MNFHGGLVFPYIDIALSFPFRPFDLVEKSTARRWLNIEKDIRLHDSVKCFVEDGVAYLVEECGLQKGGLISRHIPRIRQWRGFGNTKENPLIRYCGLVMEFWFVFCGEEKNFNK